MRNGMAQGLAALLLLGASDAVAAESEAGFDCRLAKTTIETAICSHVSARNADADMAAAYRTLRAALNPVAREQLRREQQLWLRRRATDCTTPSNRDQSAVAKCAEASDRERTTYLIEGLRAITSHVFDLSEGEAATICGEVVSAFNAGTLLSRLLPGESVPDDLRQGLAKLLAPELASQSTVYRFPLRDGSTRLFVKAVDDTESRDERIFDFAYATSTGKVEFSFPGYEDLQDDVLRWAEWGLPDNLISIAGEPVIVAARPSVPGRVGLVSWIGRGVKKPLCVLHHNGTASLRAEGGSAKSPCQAVVDGTATFIEWRNPTRSTTRRPDFIAPPPLATDHLALELVTDADLDGDGRQERIGLWRLSSGYGTGYEQEWLVELAASEEAVFKPTQVSSALHKETWGPLPAFQLNGKQARPSIFRYDGRNYILGSLGGEIGLFSIEGGKAKRQCGLEVLPHVEVQHRFPSR